jgi:hypothetical protein
MPSAFTVTNSPVTGAGTLTVTGAGSTLQYIDGTGALQTFPTTLPSTKVQHQVKAGVAINKGQAVYVTSADGTNMIVGLASNDTEATSSKTMGLLDATVSINGFANVVTEGLLAGLDTTAATSAGDPVWLGTNGNLLYGMANKPSAPSHMVFIGIVTRINLNNGEIFVKVQNGFELQELHNVQITSTPADNTVLSYENSSSLYKMKSIATLLGYTPVSGTGTTNYISKFTGSTALGNSLLYDNGTNVLIGSTTVSTDYSNALLALAKSNGYSTQEIRGVNQSTLALTSGVTANSTTPAIELFNSYNFGIKFIGGSTGGFSNYAMYYYAGDGAGTGDYTMFQVGGSERMRIVGGNVLIGTTTNAGFKLDVNGTTRSQGKLTITTGGAEITGLITGYSGLEIYGGEKLFSAGTLQFFNSANNSIAQMQYVNANGLQYNINSQNIGGVKKGIELNSNLIAAANSDILLGLDIIPTFTNGAFTGVSNYALRAQGDTLITKASGALQLSVTSQTTDNSFLTVLNGTTGLQFTSRGSGATGNMGLPANSAEILSYQKAALGIILHTTPYLAIGSQSTEMMRLVSSTGNLLINTTTDAGYKLDVNGTARVVTSLQVGNFTPGVAGAASTILTQGRISASGGITFYNPAAGDNQDVGFKAGGNGVAIYINNGTIGSFGGYGASLNPLLSLSSGFNPSSGTGNKTVFSLTPTYQTSGTFSGGITGILYNPALSTLTGVTYHRAIETVSGDVLFGTTSGVVGIGTTNLSTEANLYLGAKGTTEGGQLILQKGTAQTYATHLDNYTDQFRIMYGTDTGSTGIALAVSMSTKQLILPAYTTTSSFSGTVVGYLAFDSSGNVLTVTAPSGAVTSVNAGTGVSVSSTTGNVTVSIGQSVATSATPSFDQVFATNNGNGTNFKVGDDAWIGDVNTADTFRVMGQQNAANGYIIFGNSNFTALGRSGTGALTYGGYTIYHSNNSNTITALGTITTGVWNGTAITDTYISSASTWNAKQNALTLTTTGTSGAATLVGATLNIPQYQSVLTNPVTGTGTTNYVTKWTSSSAVGSSVIYDDGTNIGVGTTSPSFKTQISSAAGNSTSISTIASTNYGLVIQNTTNVLGTYTGIGFMNPFDTQGYIAVQQASTGYGAGGNMIFAVRPSGGGTVMTERMRIASTGNVLIGTTTDSGYLLDAAGVIRANTATEKALRVENTNGNYIELTVGAGSALGAGVGGIYFNGSPYYAFGGSANIWYVSYHRVANNAQTFQFYGGYGSTTLGNSIYLGSNTVTGGAFTATSGTQNTVSIGAESNAVWQPASGTAVYNLLNITPRINTSGTYAGTVRGLYINPTLTSTTGTTFRAIETVSGDVYLGSTSGSVGIGIAPSSNDILSVGGNINLGAYKLYNGAASDSAGLWFNSNVTNISGYSGISFRSSAAGIQVQSIRMSIFPTGNVAIGTTTDAGYKLDINGTARVQGTLAFNNGNTYVSNNSNNIWIAAVNSTANDIALIPGQQVNVSNTGTYTAQTTALVQIDSTTKGFLPPRMTATQRGAISTPAVGLVVYQTDGVEGLYVNTSGGWKSLTMV